MSSLLVAACALLLALSGLGLVLMAFGWASGVRLGDAP